MDFINTIIQYAPCVMIAALLIWFFIVTILNEKNKIKNWLVFAVTEAEKSLGTGTGKLKIRQVYDAFIGKFPVFSTFITFERFSGWVDEALVSMKHMINNNPLIDEYVNKE